MDHWKYGRASQQQGHTQPGQLGFSAGSATPYGSQLFPQSSFGQAYGQQILGAGGKTTGPDDYQGVTGGSAGLSGGTGVNMSGIYGLDSKFSSSGYGVAGASPAAFNQNADQLSGLGQYSKSHSSFLAADGHGDALQRLSDTQLLQTALRQGAAPSVLDSRIRSQSDYLSSGRNPAGGGAFGAGRELLGNTYGVTRSEAEAALLGTQVGLTARTGVGIMPFQSQAADSLGSLAGGRGILGSMYPPATGYSSLDMAAARGGMGVMSDLAGIGAARYDDRLDDRIALRYDFDRIDDERRVRERSRERDRDRERDRERERSWERERERERERQREREWARERDRIRDRERARERDRERERELRRRERTPPRLLPQPRREERVGKKFSPPPTRFSSPLKPKKREYLCKVEPFSLGESERDLLSLIRRYPRLYVAADFSKVVVCWRNNGLDVALNQPISFEHEVVDVEEESEAKVAVTIPPEEAETHKEDIKWTVKVMLMSGASPASTKDLLSDWSTEDKPPHIHNFLRFVVIRKERSALMGIGGIWDKQLDGGDPAADESALISTAIRCTKEATQLDLGGVVFWKRLMEVHYDRVTDNNIAYKEITVFLIPDLSGCLPNTDDWKLQWKQRKEAKLRREASQKQELEGKPAGSPKDPKKEKSEKREDQDVKEEKTDRKRDDKAERDSRRDAAKEKETKDEKRDAKKEKELKKEENKDKDAKREDKDSRKEDQKERDGKLDDKKEKDIKQEDKKDKDVKKEDKKDKDVKKEDKKQDLKKDKKSKVERKEGEKKTEKKDDKDTKAEKKDDKDVKASKTKTSDKKAKAITEEEAPDIPGFFLTSKRSKSEKSRAMTISLEGLLDYDERDKEESTFELSLFAEVFQEMLQYRYGSQLLEAFESLHHALVARKKEERKRARHEKETKAVSKKKSKFSDNATPVANTDAVSEKEQQHVAVQEKDDAKVVKDIDTAMQEASLINFDELEEELQETPEVLDAEVADVEDTPQESEKIDRKLAVDEELLKAFVYFDRNRLGFLKAEDVRRLVHILGRFLTRRWVKDLTSSALTESKSKDDCIYYRKLVEKEALEEKQTA